MPVMMPPYALRYSLANGRVRSMAPGSHRLWPRVGSAPAADSECLSPVASHGHAAIRSVLPMIVLPDLGTQCASHDWPVLLRQPRPHGDVSTRPVRMCRCRTPRTPPR